MQWCFHRPVSFFRPIFPQSLKSNKSYKSVIKNQRPEKSISDVLIGFTSSICNDHSINAYAYGTVVPFSWEMLKSDARNYLIGENSVA